MTSVLEDELRRACPGLRVKEPLSPHTSLAVGGPARVERNPGRRQHFFAARRCGGRAAVGDRESSVEERARLCVGTRCDRTEDDERNAGRGA